MCGGCEGSRKDLVDNRKSWLEGGGGPQFTYRRVCERVSLCVFHVALEGQGREESDGGRQS